MDAKKRTADFAEVTSDEKGREQPRPRPFYFIDFISLNYRGRSSASFSQLLRPPTRLLDRTSDGTPPLRVWLRQRSLT
jgi:hypothetical protein